MDRLLAQLPAVILEPGFRHKGIDEGANGCDPNRLEPCDFANAQLFKNPQGLPSLLTVAHRPEFALPILPAL